MNISGELAKILSSNEGKGTKPYDTKATVKRVENGVAWVHIPGGVDETPAQLTINAKPGDSVQLRVADGKAFLVGNGSSPPTDDTTARQAIDFSKIASDAANAAIQDANTARTAAASAQSSATEAKTIAEGVEDVAKDAQESANDAKQSADTAFRHLGFVEDIVGVLELVSKNGVYELTQDPEAIQDKWYFERTGISPNYVYKVVTIPTTYSLTTDTEIDPSKTYYTRSGTAPDYVYLPVENPVVEEIGTYYEAHKDPTGYYELTDIKQSIQNYVSSHIALDGEGLWVQLDKSGTKILLSPNEGIVLYDNNGYPVGQYGQTAFVGNKNGFHIRMDGTELGFYKGSFKVAYMSGEKLYIPQSVVLQQMDVGLPYGHTDAQGNQDGWGQWSWKLHLNNENPPRNNLNLKWIG